MAQIQLPDPVPLHMFEPKSYTVLAYGRNGTGKTEFAATWPKPILYIDTDQGITTVLASPRIKDKDQISVVPIADYPTGVKTTQPLGFLTVKQVIDDIAKTGKYGNCQPATVVLDTLTTAASFCMSYVLYINRHVGQQPTLPDWGRQIRELVALIQTGVGLDCNFITLAHEQFMRDELSGRIWCVPLITGKLAMEIGLYFDELYHANVQERAGKHEYMLDTKATGLITAKSRLDLASPIKAHFDEVKKAMDRLKTTKGGEQMSGSQTVNPKP